MSPVDETHDPGRRSWVASADAHPDFPIQNLPLGVFAPDGGVPRGGVAIGDEVLDLAALAALGHLEGEAQTAAAAGSQPTLNALLALGAGPRRALRRELSRRLSDTAYRAALAPTLHPVRDCTLHLPAAVGDYTDFYVGIHHATNVGRLFRPDQPLMPNYKHIPIGYHGRASSVRVDGHPVKRPRGQTFTPGAERPMFGPSARLDYELEMGVWIAGSNALGTPVSIGDAADRIAGLCLLNDWSARDLQAWEYQPLGPFLSKSFLTTVSPWIVTAEALAPFRAAQPPRPAGDPAPMPYLWDAEDQRSGGYAIEVEAWLSSAEMRRLGQPPRRLSRGSLTGAMYWTAAQMITHHTTAGCDLRAGDLLGTGTLSTASADGLGSLLEASRGGAETISLSTGEIRAFLQDGDEVSLTASARAEGAVSIGFGACRGTVVD